MGPEILLSPKVQAILAGAAGGLVRWMTLRERWRTGVLSVFTGSLMALYASPVVLPVFETALGPLSIDKEQIVSFSGFMIGLGGVAVAGFIIDVWKGYRRFTREGDRDGDR